MVEKEIKIEADFNEALRCIANTPKSAATDKGLINAKDVGYNDLNEATKKPPLPVKRRR